MKVITKRIFLFIVLFIWTLNCTAQLFPVQLTPVFKSPYSVKISDYATSMDTKFQLLVNPTDVTISQRQVRLKLYIQGNGINIRSSDFITGQKPIFINGGEFQTLTNTDISALFRLENLQGITPSQYANPLPDGMYDFCFEMYDFITNQKISQKSCAGLYIILNDPPFLNTPQKNEQIAASDFPNIMFTWTPRQMNATNVSYKFELKQLIDPTLDAQFAFQMSPLLYEETIFSTALLYNLSMPILTPGMCYAWRVKAISTTGLSENAVFKNDGYSEIYSFKYTQKCNAPTFALSEIVSPGSVIITWQGTPDHTKYQVQYRKKAITETNKRGKTKEKIFEWFSTYSLNNQVLITNLETETEYEFKVGSSCTTEAEGIQSFSYSNTNTFTIPKKENAIASYNCGIKPNLNIGNKTPLTNLIQSETFTAGDFPVTILELKGKNSPYSGRGYIIVPYLADTKIAVEFSNIVINTDYQLINGVVETSYNPDWNNVVDVKDVFSNITSLVDGLYDLLKKKEAGSITDEKFVEERLAYINKIQEQLDELKKDTDLPEDLKKKIEDLKPVLLDLASNDWTASGNHSKENIDKVAQTSKEIDAYKQINCQDLGNGKIVLQDLDQYKIYGTPAGKYFVLKGAVNLALESIYPNEKYPDLKVPKGALVAFTNGNVSYKAKYRKDSNKWKFIGYFNNEGDKYVDTDTAVFLQKIEKDGKTLANFPLVLIAGTSKEFSKSILKSIGFSEAAIAGEGLLSIKNVGVALLATIIIETFVVSSTVTPMAEEYVLDLPETTPITFDGEADKYVKDIPVDLPIAIPHALPKDETGNKGCQVYCIYKKEKNTKELTIAKYGMTCQENFKSDGKQDCNPRPEYQTNYFNKTEPDFNFYYTWVTPVEVSKETAYVIEKSMIALYISNNKGELPSHHKRPCFVVGDDWNDQLRRENKAIDWIKEQVLKYGK